MTKKEIKELESSIKEGEALLLRNKEILKRDKVNLKATGMDKVFESTRDGLEKVIKALKAKLKAELKANK